MHRTRIALLTEVRGWHEARLREALRRRGAEVVRVALTRCRIGFASGRRGLELPGFDDALPDAAFVRSIPAGTFEQVTFRLAVLHALRESGVPVYNDARVIERTVDKGMTSFLLARAGVASVPTWVCETREVAERVLRRETGKGERLVLKPLFGSCGKGLRLLDAGSALPPPDATQGVYYLQRFVAPARGAGRDLRIMVVGGRAAAAMERHAEGWITNRARGGVCHPIEPEPEATATALAAVAAVGAAYAGVDLIRDAGGRHVVLEVNGIPAWKGLQAVSGTDIAAALAEDLLARVPRERLEAMP